MPGAGKSNRSTPRGSICGLRLPPGWDAVEVPARARGAEKLSRGTVYANLTVERKGVAPTVKINEPVLNAVLATLRRS